MTTTCWRALVKRLSVVLLLRRLPSLKGAMRIAWSLLTAAWWTTCIATRTHSWSTPALLPPRQVCTLTTLSLAAACAMKTPTWAWSFATGRTRKLFGIEIHWSPAQPAAAHALHRRCDPSYWRAVQPESGRRLMDETRTNLHWAHLLCILDKRHLSSSSSSSSSPSSPLTSHSHRLSSHCCCPYWPMQLVPRLDWFTHHGYYILAAPARLHHYLLFVQSGRAASFLLIGYFLYFYTTAEQ